MKRILVTGVFDGMHTGHRYFLTRAKEVDLSARLTVIVMSDDYVRDRKHSEPLQDLDVRLEQVKQHPQVNEVYVANSDLEVKMLITALKPLYRVAGDDYAKKDVIRNKCAKVILIPRLQGFASRDLRLNTTANRVNLKSSISESKKQDQGT